MWHNAFNTEMGSKFVYCELNITLLMRLHATIMALRIPYSQKIWQGIKFGGLVVYNYNYSPMACPTIHLLWVTSLQKKLDLGWGI